MKWLIGILFFSILASGAPAEMAEISRIDLGATSGHETRQQTWIVRKDVRTGLAKLFLVSDAKGEKALPASSFQIKAITDAVNELSIAPPAAEKACSSFLKLKSEFGNARICSPQTSVNPKVRTLLGDLSRWEK